MKTVKNKKKEDAAYDRKNLCNSLQLKIILLKMSPSKDIKLDLNFKVSPEFSCVLIKGIVEYLLYYRHQIPFNFELFEKLIKNKKEEEANCFKKLKLLNLARHTYEGICGIKTVSYKRSWV